MAHRSRARRPRVVKRADHQTGSSNLSRDKKYKALPPGKRISKNGNPYYEYRRNRSDLTRDEMPSRRRHARGKTGKKRVKGKKGKRGK